MSSGSIASPKVCWNDTAIRPRTTSDSCLTLSSPVWNSASAASMWGMSAFAAGVNRTPRPSRISSSVPTMALARAMARLTVDCGRPRSSAVSVMCSVRPSSASSGSRGSNCTSCLCSTSMFPSSTLIHICYLFYGNHALEASLGQALA
jgi:hypothetical protein